jgi:hypothetical protein
MPRAVARHYEVSESVAIKWGVSLKLDDFHWPGTCGGVAW